MAESLFTDIINNLGKSKVKVTGSGSKTGKQQIVGAPQGITSDKENINLQGSAEIPITNNVDFLLDGQYNKFRDNIEYKDNQIFLEDAPSNINRKVGIGFNKDGEGFGGYAKYDIDKEKPEFFLGYKKTFADGGSTNGSAEKAFSAKVNELMDDGYDFGEAVKEAMRQGYAKAGLVDPENNIKKGQDLGEGIAQRLKYTNKEGKKTIRYVTSGMKDTPIEEHKTFKEAQNYRKSLIEKYGDPKELGEYKGKYNYKELIKDKDFEDFWKAKVDGDKIATRTGKFKGERSVEDAIQKVIKKYKLKPNDYENIFNKVVEETRISEAVRKGTRAGQGKTKLISAAIVDNLVETFNKSYKPNLGTINTSEMEKLLKLSKGELSKLMSNIEKPYPEEALRFAKSDTVSRINKAAVLKDLLEQEGITYSKMARGGGEGIGSAEYRFKLDPDKNKAAAKLKQLKNSKTFGFLKQTTPKSQNVKQTITTLSKQSDEYKKYGYGRDRNAINNLTKALNNSLRSMNDKELYNFVDKNSKIKNLVTATFDAKTGQIKNVPLKNMDIQQIRNNAQFEVDHIRGRSTVDFDPTTKKILDGLDIEYPKNLYIIPKAINNSVKKQVESFVSNFPNETSKIKNIDNYFKKNKLTYFNRNTGNYGGYKPSKSALDISHLGITKKKELEKLITGTYIDEQGVERVKTNDPKKTIATINEINKTRGGTQLSANPFLDPKAILTGLGDVARFFGTPSVAAAFAGTAIKENLEKGDSLLDAATDKMVGIDLLYPEIAKQTVGRFAQPTGRGILSMLGRVAMNPFGRAARAFTPVGAGITAIGLGKDYYDFVQSDLARKAADPEAYAAEQEEQMGMSA